MVAIHVHLREHHTRHQPSSQAEQEEDKIAIRGFDNESGEIRLVREWRRGFDEPCGLFCACSPRTHETRPHADPGDATLLTLASLCVEINARRSEPWEMPATISEVVKKLNGVGVVSVKDLRQALTAPVSDGSVPARGSAAGFHLNSTLRTSGHRAFGEETLEIMRRLLGWVQVGRITSHRTESGRVASRRVASRRVDSTQLESDSSHERQERRKDEKLQVLTHSATRPTSPPGSRREPKDKKDSFKSPHFTAASPTSPPTSPSPGTAPVPSSRPCSGRTSCARGALASRARW